MTTQSQTDQTPFSELTAPVQSHIIPLEHSPDGQTHVVTDAAGIEHVTGVFPPFDATTFPSQLLWLAISFAALYFLMSRVALPQVGDILEKRRYRIEGDIAEADRLRGKTDQAIATYEAALAEARASAHAIAETAREAIKTDLSAQRSQVETELSAKVAEAEARIEATKSEALSHVGEIAADIARAVAGRFVGEVPPETARTAVARAEKE